MSLVFLFFILFWLFVPRHSSYRSNKDDKVIEGEGTGLLRILESPKRLLVQVKYCEFRDMRAKGINNDRSCDNGLLL